MFRATPLGVLWSLALSRAAATETRLVFMHINESGGSTWVKWMKDHQRLCVANGNLGSGCGVSKKLCSLPGPGFQEMLWRGQTAVSMVLDMALSNCTFVELHHWDVAVAHAFRAFGYEMMTIVRDPASRIASMFNYAIERGIDQNTSIEDFYNGVKTPDRTLGFLTGCYSCCSGLQHLRDGAPGYSSHNASDSDCSSAPQQCALLRATAAATESLGVVAGANKECARNITSLLSVAFANLRAFDFVGVLEHMDKTASLFCAQYGVCFSPETLRTRANSHHKVLDIDKDKKAASVLRDALRPDLAVYDLAVLLLDQNIAQVPNWARSRVLPGERVRSSAASEQLARAKPGEAAGVQNFVIFSRARSGTTWLISMLNGHPEISCDGELLLKVKTDAALKQFYAAFDRSGRLHEGTKAHEASKRRIGAQGFKWFHYQAGIELFEPHYNWNLDNATRARNAGRAQEWAAWLQRNHFKIVVFEREDRLARIVSGAKHNLLKVFGLGVRGLGG